VKECVAHELLEPYPVVYEREGDVVAHAKFTVLLLPSGTTKITGMSIDYSAYSSDKVSQQHCTAVAA
jgi:hypothetical protein